MITKTERLSRPASASVDDNSRSLGDAAVDMAKRFCMTPVSRRAWLVGLGLAVGIIFRSAGVHRSPRGRGRVGAERALLHSNSERLSTVDQTPRLPKLYGCTGQCLSDDEQRVPYLCGDLRELFWE